MPAIEEILSYEADQQDDPSMNMLLNSAAHEIVKLREIIAKHQPRLRKLQLLENYGVDNWQGYDEAMSELYDDEDTE